MAEGKGKGHRKKKSGRKAEKRKTAERKKRGDAEGNPLPSAVAAAAAAAAAPPKPSKEDAAAARARNPKAFVFASRGKARAARARTAERDQRRMHAPAAEREPEEPPPLVVLVQGPPGVGKTTLIRCLVRHYARQELKDPRGPVTVVAGKARRLTFLECPPDLPSMLDAAKFADLVLLLVDGAFGFEMETFEFLNMLQAHGFPKVMGVLTHLDGFRDAKALKKTKKALKHRFWAEVYSGAKLFYLSGLRHGKYLKREVHNLVRRWVVCWVVCCLVHCVAQLLLIYYLLLFTPPRPAPNLPPTLHPPRQARFVSVMKTRPLGWRGAHPYLLADRVEDATPAAALAADPLCDRDVLLMGWLRGAAWRPGAVAGHVAGVGDFRAGAIEAEALPDPCPPPGKGGGRRGLGDRQRLLHAPMSDVGGLLYDRDAMCVSFFIFWHLLSTAHLLSLS